MAEIISVHTMADAEALRTMEYAPRIRLPRASRSSKQDSAFHRTIELAPHRVRICSLDHLRTSAAVLEIVDEKLAEGRGCLILRQLGASTPRCSPLRAPAHRALHHSARASQEPGGPRRAPPTPHPRRRHPTHREAPVGVERGAPAGGEAGKPPEEGGGEDDQREALRAAWFEKRIASLIAHIRKVQTKRIPLI